MKNYMIDMLLDEPSDLNDLSKKLISIYPSIDPQLFHTMTAVIEIEEIVDPKTIIPISFLVDDKEMIEANFKLILSNLLQDYGYLTEDVPNLMPNYLKDFRSMRDINDLILSCVMISLMKSTESQSPFPSSHSLNYKTRMFVRSFHKPSYEMYFKLTGQPSDE